MPPLETLRNDRIKLAVHPLGAEMHHLYNLQTGNEYLWGADPETWSRHAPVLFPIVGRLKDDSLLVDGESYRMRQHGFARDSEFDLVRSTDTLLDFQLNNSEETFIKYPFKFQLNIVYELTDNLVSVTYRVHNPDKNKGLPFSIGAHPAFNCPTGDDLELSDYYLEFEKEEHAERQYLVNGLRSGQKKALLKGGKTLSLSDNLFDDDALVFGGLRSSHVWLRTKEADYGVKVYFKGFPYLGIWSKPGAPFVCIEPWHGIADTETGHEDFRTKEGVRNLKPQTTFECQWAFEIY